VEEVERVAVVLVVLLADMEFGTVEGAVRAAKPLPGSLLPRPCPLTRFMDGVRGAQHTFGAARKEM
jgi:hypothetical protein